MRISLGARSGTCAHARQKKKGTDKTRRNSCLLLLLLFTTCWPRKYLSVSLLRKNGEQDGKSKRRVFGGLVGGNCTKDFFSFFHSEFANTYFCMRLLSLLKLLLSPRQAQAYSPERLQEEININRLLFIENGGGWYHK